MDSYENFDREEQLNNMRERTEEKERERHSALYLRKERDRKWDNARTILFYVVLGLSLLCAILLYAHNYRLSTYSVDREIPLSSAKSAELFEFGGGHIVVGADSVTYYVNNEMVYTRAVSMQDPVFAKEGDYFALYGKNGYQVVIGDATGIQATVKVSRTIQAMDISAAGVIAVCTESDDMGYITYYDRYGNHIAVEMKTALNISGYPVNLSISPDGQKLAVIYYTVANGIGESRIVFYDFQKGREDKSYVIASFDDFYDTDTFLVSVNFTDNKHLCAVGDNMLVFLTYNGVDTVTRMDVRHKDKVKSVYEQNTNFLVATEKGEETRLTRYDMNGRELNSFEAPAEYEEIRATDKYVLFRNGDRVSLFNVSGKLRYEGTLTEAPVSLSFCKGRSILINTGESLQKITLK